MLSDLAFALAERGIRISVITSRQLYDTPNIRLPRRETVAGVQVHRVWTSCFGRHNLAGRAIDYLTFYLSAAWRLWRLARQGDIIVAKTDPPMLSVVLGPIVRMRRAYLVNWLQDLFPEVLEALVGRRSSPRRAAFKLLRALRNRSLRQAKMNIVIGERMAERLARLDVLPQSIRIIPNWADGTLVTPRHDKMNLLRQQWDLSDKFVIGYSGNLGRAHEFDTLIDAIARLEQDPHVMSVAQSKAGRMVVPHRPIETSTDTSYPMRDIVWLFIGGGALHRQFQTEIATRGLTSVHFRPYQPRERLAESLSVPDVHLVSLRTELEGLIVPSKYYGIAAAGRPTIFVGDSDGEIARVLTAADAGWTVTPNDGAQLAALIRTLVANPGLTQEMGRRARSGFERSFDFPIAVAAWEKALATCDRVSHEANLVQNSQTTKHADHSQYRRRRVH